MSHQQIQILHVDDDPEFADLTATYLERDDDRFVVETATSADEGLTAIADCPPDCVVSDYNMPGMDGLEFLQAVREEYSDLPFILVTGEGGEDVASDAISAGVTDYLQKDTGTSQYTVLANRIRHAVDRYYTQTELAEREKRLNLFFEQSPLGVVEWDDQFDFVRMNDAAEDILGYTQDDLDGHSWQTIVPESDRDAVADAVANLLEDDGGYHSINENVRKDGGRITCEWHNRVVTDEDGAVVAVFSQFQDITEQNRQERENNRRRRRLEQILKTVPGCVVQLDADGQFVFANDRAEAVLGLDSDDVTDRTYDDPRWSLRAPNGDRIPDEELPFRQIRETGEPVYGERLSVEWPDGTRKLILVNGAPVFDEHGTFESAVFSLVDITDREQRQQELEQTQALMANMEALADVGAWEYDSETETLMVTDGTRRLYGLEPDADLTLAAALDAVHPDDRDQLADRLDTCLETGEPYEIEVRLTPRDGGQRWITARGERVERHESGPVVRGYIQDITEDRQQRIQLEETAARLEALFERSPNMIDIHDTDGNILDANQRLAERTGYTQSELTEMKIWDLDTRITPEEARTLWREMDPDDRRQLEGVYQCRDGSTFPVEVHIRRLDIEDDDLFVAISRDITEQTQREQELSAQNERLEEFASIVSHDLRSPLGVAEGHLELAGATDENEHLAKAADAVERSQALIDDLLTLAREGNQVDEIERVDLAEMAESSWETTETESATLDVTVTQTIQADRSRLQQLFENLYRNSVEHGSTSSRPEADDAVEHGGEGVTVTVGAIDDGFSVADTGPGIPESEREDVFEAGYSTDEDGTGFGLRIVEQIAEAHGWDISVTESDQGGARFEVTGVSRMN
jgi:PAS domain S-box-containing protein